MVAQTAPTRLVRVRIFNNLSVYYYLKYGIIRYVYLFPSSLTSWVKLAFLFSELLYIFIMNNEVQKLSFLQEFFFKRLYNHPAKARGKNTYVQELVDEVKHTVDSCEDLFLWLRQNLDHYWATQFPWTVEVTGFSDIPYLKVTFDYKLNEKGELYVLDNWCSKNSLEIPDEYFSKSEVEIDLTVHFNKKHNIIVFDYRTEV